MEKKPSDQLLKEFIEEHFDFDSLKEIGFFKGIKKKDYKSQAKRITTFFGLKSIYEYGSKSIRCHITYLDPESPFESSRPKFVNSQGKIESEPFITEIKSIYED